MTHVEVDLCLWKVGSLSLSIKTASEAFHQFVRITIEMATSESQAAPEPMAVDEGEELAPAPLLSLRLLQVVKTAQAQHGLRHSDYTRYR